MGKRKRGSSMPGTVDTTEADKLTPKSIVIYRGEVSAAVRALMQEWRRVLLPWSSQHLHGRNRSLKDFMSVASVFSVSHLQLFTSPPRGTCLRITRFSNGPTLSFRVESFSLSQDIVPHQRRPIAVTPHLLETPAMLVLNNFTHAEALRRPEVPLLEATFKAIFPSINIQVIKNSDIRRVCLVQYNHKDHVVEIRHYAIQAKATALRSTVKKLLEQRLPTKLGTLDSFDEVLDKEGAWSDTDGEGETVGLAEPFLNHREQCRVKLCELGPRMTLRLMKVENGFAQGEVLYHATEKKTLREVQLNAARVRSTQAGKAKRRAEQEERVQKKRSAKEEKMERKRARREQAVKDQQANPFEVGEYGADDDGYEAETED